MSSLYISTEKKQMVGYPGFYRVFMRFHRPFLRPDGTWGAPGRELGTFTLEALESHGLPLPGEMGLLTVTLEVNVCG